jgi:hypothetical protein
MRSEPEFVPRVGDFRSRSGKQKLPIINDLKKIPD